MMEDRMRKILFSFVLAVALTFGFVCDGYADETMVKKVDYFSLMMDRSGSMFMKSECIPNANKMFVAKTAVQNVFEAVPDELGLDSALKLSCEAKTILVGKYSQDVVIKFLKNDVPDDGSIFGKMTPLYKAVAEETVSEPITSANAVILVTDGDYNLGKSPVVAVKELYAKHPETTVHIISLADTPKGEKTIQEIAALKNGSCVAKACALAKSKETAKAFAMAVFFGNENSLEVYFDRDNSVIKASEKSKLDTVKGKAVRVEGWASIDGPKDYNQALSQRRAAAVAEYLGISDFEGKGISTKYAKRKMNRRADVITQ